MGGLPRLFPQSTSAYSDLVTAVGVGAGGRFFLDRAACCEGKRLPNPHVLIRLFVRREAVLSSRIEGTQATLGGT